MWNNVRMKELVLIPTYPCAINERIGKWGDGGKWTCLLPNAIQKTNPVVYSIGSFGMYSFEKEMHQMLRTMPYTFDPFLPPEKRNVMASLPFLHFIEIGLSGTATLPTYRSKFPEKKFATLPEMMGQFGHSYADVFKIDCEGCEVEWIKDLGKQYNNTGKRLAVHGGKLPFGQILIEFHKGMDKSVKTLTMVYTLENLGYRMFSIEYNHRCAVCCEMSFIHESLPGSKVAAEEIEKEKKGEDNEEEEEETASEKVVGNRKVKIGGKGKEEGSSKGTSKVTSKGSVKGSTKERSTKVGKKISKEKSSKTSKKETKEEEEEE
ncbi:unnamed protein product [Closterium sp. Naga37s-1]|nr:unnamed protein product [Closterium sp. Naga37s-1]